MKKLYVLQTYDSGCLAICTSLKKMSEIIDENIRKFPQILLIMKEYIPNRFDGEDCWTWAYIPTKGYTIRRLHAGGARVPMKEYWGHNLLTLPEVSDPEYPGERWKADSSTC